MLPKGSTDLIARAFGQIIGNGGEGDVAYAGFLPSQDIDLLCSDRAFVNSGWSIFGVADRNDESQRLITADHAVELRERKADALLLLIDRERAGAGLDGIYTSAREVKEAEFLEAAVSLARASVGHGLGGFAREAIRRSRLGGRRNLSLWRVFDFYVALGAGTPPGAAVLTLGLWPIQSERPAELLSESEHMVFRLFVGRERDVTIQDLVASLLIDDPAKASELADFLREVRHLDRFAAIDRLASRTGIWLGGLRPRVHGEILRSMELVPWRGRHEIPLKWSGLTPRDGKLVLLLDRRPDAKSPGRLEVRWRTTPDKLREGAATYTIEVCSDDEVLASGQLTHRGENPQKFVFALDDFESLQSDQVFEPLVRISAQGTEPLTTEIFRLEFGEAPERGIGGSAGRRVRCVGEGLLAAKDREDFDHASREAHTKPEAEKKVFLLWRSAGPVARPFKVYRPPLLREIEEAWHQREQGAIGRWSVRVTSEGKRLESPEFHKFEPGAANVEAWRRFESASQRIARELGEGFGIVARALAVKWAALDEYLLAWLRVLPSASPELALVNTVEVKGLSDRFEGLIVLPLHPLRLAWHAAYEALAAHARYEEGMTPTSVEETLRVLDSANFPWMLPGITEGHTLVFGDTLGFHATAMIPEDAAEPKGTVSLLARCLSDGDVEVAPSVGQQTAKVLAGEIDYYLRLHPQTNLLNLQALRAGDGMTIARALGQVVNGKKSTEDDTGRQGPLDDSQTGLESDADEPNPLCFTLNLLEGEQEGICGRFLLEVANSRRASGIVGEADRWITESVERNGGVTMPRLRWARKRESEFTSSAHLAIAFDTFQSRVEALPSQSVSFLERPGRAYGLVGTIERQVFLSPVPTWRLFQPQKLTGQKHPAQRSLTERLTDIQIALSNAVVRNLSADPATSWPVLVTKLKAEDHERFERLHRNSGWVITADRNACIEYFDSPRDQPAIYDAYILDCVPEREDLGTVQLVTSTTHKEELYGVFESGFRDAGLDVTAEEIDSALGQLKALSGRLAIRMSSPHRSANDLLALATLRANCEKADKEQSVWPPLAGGFFVPIDEIADVIELDSRTFGGESRPDLIFVRIRDRALDFQFIRVCFRRHLRLARDPDFLDHVSEEITRARDAWERKFSAPKGSAVERAIRRSSLARVLHFYNDKARRHANDSDSNCFDEDTYQSLRSEIDKMLSTAGDYQFAVSSADSVFLFCPEYFPRETECIYEAGIGNVSFYLFGRESKNAESSGSAERAADGEESGPPLSQEASSADGENEVSHTLGAGASSSDNESERDIDLGKDIATDTPVRWVLSIKRNPHLMIAGLPGMGKTTSLVNICQQLNQFGIGPIVFSYHPDIDARLESACGVAQYVDYNGLSFNPLRVDASTIGAFIDVAGDLRDIFLAIFPDLGDIQAETIRSAIKQSYIDSGWTLEGTNEGAQMPQFSAFFDIIRGEKRADRGVLFRLGELADYGLFKTPGGSRSLLDARGITIVRIHRTGNELLQRAFATLVLYSVYKDMLRRGPVDDLSHAVIFDEAHRASRLKLLPRMAKECRKYGLSLILASQEARDFDRSLFSAIASYLTLRVTENDARVLAKQATSSQMERRIVDRLKQLDRYHALFFTEGNVRPREVRLSP